jgi:dTDP-glucose pyrophosphorylase
MSKHSLADIGAAKSVLGYDPPVDLATGLEATVAWFRSGTPEARHEGNHLAGGLGTRLAPLTNITNKHLLPVWDKPMIYYPIGCLVNAGITDIMIVTGGNYAGDFLRLLRNGEDFGLNRLNYAYQKGEGGIADALRLCEGFADGESVCVVLGDNIIENNIVRAAREFAIQKTGAEDHPEGSAGPERFGVAEQSPHASASSASKRSRRLRSRSMR